MLQMLIESGHASAMMLMDMADPLLQRPHGLVSQNHWMMRSRTSCLADLSAVMHVLYSSPT